MMSYEKYPTHELTPYISSAPGDRVFMDRLMSLSHAQLADPTLQLEDLCDRLAVSKSTLYRKVKAISGLSPNQFIRKARLQKAASLLVKGYGSVSEVAYEVGFNNPSYFSKCFQEEFGQTPSTYRKDGISSPVWAKPLTRFFGRETELATLRNMLQDARLITLTGTGGSGKTRLATEMMANLEDDFHGRMFFIPLAPLCESELVLPTIAHALRIPDNQRASPRENIVRHITDRKYLLLLDNFEHLTEAAPGISALLKACPKLQVVVTSRVALNLEGEREYLVRPLPFPSSDAEDALRFPAVQLFVDRARAVNPHFLLEAKDFPTLSAICRKLDGLPLALELAAASVRAFSLKEILTNLDHPTDTLQNGPVDKDHRHQSLFNCIRWSYNLLRDSRKTFFMACAVFSGGFTFDALRKVIGNSLSYTHCDQLLADLLAASLVQRESDGLDESRYYLLATIRDFALQLLKASGCCFDVFSAHAHYYRQLAQKAEPHFTGAKQHFWLTKIEADIDNIRAALGWFYDQQQAVAGLTMTKALMRFWIIRSGAREGRVWAVKFLNLPATISDSMMRANVLFSLGVIEGQRCVDLTQCVKYLEESISIFHSLEEKTSLADALNHLGWVKSVIGEYQDSRQLTCQAKALHKSLGNKRGISVSLMNLGWEEELEGNYQPARTLFTDCCRIRRELGDDRGWAYPQSHLAILEYQQGYYERAERRLQKTIHILTKLKDHQLSAFSQTHLGLLYYYLAQSEKALQLFHEAQELWVKVDNQWGVSFTKSCMALGYLSLQETSPALPLLNSALESWENMPCRYGEALSRYGLGKYWLAKGDEETAYYYCKTSLLLRIPNKNRLGIAESLELWAEIALEKKDYPASTLALAQSKQMRSQMGAPRSPLDQRTVDPMYASLRSHMPQPEYEHWTAKGASLALEELNTLLKMGETAPS